MNDNALFAAYSVILVGIGMLLGLSILGAFAIPPRVWATDWDACVRACASSRFYLVDTNGVCYCDGKIVTLED